MYLLNRPLEILVLVGLNGAIGAITLLNGLATGGLHLPSGISLGPDPNSIINSVLSIIGSFAMPVGAAFFGSVVGLFLGKGWGWTMSRALQVVGIVFGFGFLYVAGGQSGIMGLYSVGMIMSGISIGFLYTPEVREFYGKAPVVPVRRQRRKKDLAEESEEPSAAEVE